jgi:hypothetical protein
MDLWRSDAALVAPAPDPDALAARVLASPALAAPRVETDARQARRMAAAAAVLAAVGLAGAGWLGPDPTRVSLATPSALVSLEADRLDLEVESLLEELPVVLPAPRRTDGRKEGR